MKRNEFRPVPDHSRAGISEAYEAALYSAAFQRMEENEMKQFDRNARATRMPGDGRFCSGGGCVYVI